MISHQNRCIFIHIPKVAGTSIISVFADPDPVGLPTQAFPFDPDGAGKFDPPPPHLRAGDYVKYGLVTREQFDAYFKFAFVRNPWDRLVSEYKYRLHPHRYDFKTFLFHHFPRPSWTDRYCHVLPQYDFLYDQDGRCLVDFVGRFENLQQDFDEVCRRLGIPPRPIPHDNPSQSILKRRRENGLCDTVKAFVSVLTPKSRRNTFLHYRDYYDDESRVFVGELYKMDIKEFGYEF